MVTRCICSYKIQVLPETLFLIPILLSQHGWSHDCFREKISPSFQSSLKLSFKIFLHLLKCPASQSVAQAIGCRRGALEDIKMRFFSIGIMSVFKMLQSPRRKTWCDVFDTEYRKIQVSFEGLFLGPLLTTLSAKVNVGSRNHMKSACSWNHHLGKKKMWEERCFPGEEKTLNKKDGSRKLWN